MISSISVASRTSPLKKVVSLNDPVSVPSMLAPLSPQIQMIRVLSISPSASTASSKRPTFQSAFSE
jgi:hypothetical protein